MTTTAAPAAPRVVRPLTQVFGRIDPTWAWRALALGLGSNLFLPVGGRISLLELVAVLALPATLATAQRRPQVLYLVAATAVMLLGTVLSSLVHDVTTLKTVAAVANYAVLVALVVGILHLVDRHGATVLRWLVAGSAVSQAVTTLVIPDASQALDTWKFGYGFAASFVVLLLVDRARSPQARLLGLAAGGGLTVVHLVLGARFLAVIVMLAVIVSALSARRSEADRDRLVPRERQSPVGKVALGTAGVVVLYLAYTQLASSGALGAVAEYKYEVQTGDYGLLIGGRKEIVFLVFAWLGSPLLGWGASSAVPYLERLDTARWFAEHGYRPDYADTIRLVQPDSLPLHSVFFGMLVVAGVFALPLALALLTSAVRAVWGSLSQDSALVVYLALLGMLHLLTSPLGDTTRAPLAACVAVGILFAARQPPPLQDAPATGIVVPEPGAAR